MTVSKGVTLIELLSSIAIVAVLMLIAAPSLFSVLNTIQLEAVSNNFFTQLRTLRSSAIKTNSSVFVSFATGSAWCYGFSSVAACACGTAGSCLYNGTAYVVTPPANQGITMSSSTIANNFSFSPDEGIASSSGSITFSNASGSISVVVSPLGRVTLCSNTIAGYTGC